MLRKISDRSLFAYIGAAMTAGALMALPLPALADSHAGAAENGADARLTLTSTPDGGGGGGGGGGEVPSAKKPRKEVRKHRRIRYVAQRPRKHGHHERFVHQPHLKVSVHDVYGDGGHGGRGGHHRHHGWHHGHHNNHFTEDLFRDRRLRTAHSERALHEALEKEAHRWLSVRTPKTIHKHGVKDRETTHKHGKSGHSVPEAKHP
ncbi:hypothetical protein [Sphaerisporangium perillae]|uniref:hypothetical protein n=1 Tax=Sphaerisporangium perillae TaxID=2935860 RepID=UPI00200E71E5|nr:hypothetical protein [Sphaerisporangium perillae]